MALLSNEAFKAAVKYLKENSVQPTKPKQHKKRSNQSENYHNRVQKKWNKRHVPAYTMYAQNNSIQTLLRIIKASYG